MDELDQHAVFGDVMNPGNYQPQRRDRVVEGLKLAGNSIGLATAVVVLATILYTNRPVFKIVGWVVALFAVLLYSLYLLPRVRVQSLKLGRHLKRGRFIRTQKVVLDELRKRFLRLSTGRETTSFHQRLESVFRQEFYSSGQQAQLQIISAWMWCFSRQLETPAGTFAAFLSRCHELTEMVFQFNEKCATHLPELVGRYSVPEEGIVEMEHFRDSYNEFLREFSRWVEAMWQEASVLKDATEDSGWIAPKYNFKPVNPLHKLKATSAGA